jgi:hypothetical chaperone protein
MVFSAIPVLRKQRTLQSFEAMAVGFDFGTTNSSLAIATGKGDIKLARFAYSGGLTESFRSLLYLERIREAGRSTIKSWSGPTGIDRYLNAEEKGRLIQSLKSFLSSRSLQSTEVFGRPVRFVGAESDEDDNYAIKRLKNALHKAGFQEVRFEYEPVAAAYYYKSTLDHDELIMIGDFGGGTSDFSLLKVGPSVRKHVGAPRHVLGNEGVGLAGDAFDAKIVRHLVSPTLGAGTSLRSGHKVLPVPKWVCFKLERWHHLSFLRSHETLNMLKSVQAQALEPERLRALLYLVTHDLGYHLHHAVQSVKVALSHLERSEFRFQDGDSELHAEVTRSEFEDWISEELVAIEQRVDALLAKTGIHARDVDMVFLTGGSSFVPAVRRIFESRFGHEKIRTGDEFTSVARGLALRALE